MLQFDNRHRNHDRAVEMDVARAEALGDDIDRISRTLLPAA
jgi:hypothetical protein